MYLYLEFLTSALTLNPKARQSLQKTNKQTSACSSPTATKELLVFCSNRQCTWEVDLALLNLALLKETKISTLFHFSFLQVFFFLVYVKVIVLPDVRTCWQLKHLETHLFDDMLGMYVPQIPIMPFWYLWIIRTINIIFRHIEKLWEL